MGYEKIDKPEGKLYHYTKRENLEQILKDGRIRRFKDRESWYCGSLEDTLRLMEMTVMQDGNLYYDVYGFPRHYPPFEAEEYVILEFSPRYQNGEWVRWNQEFPEGTPGEVLRIGEEFSHLKLGFRGDLKFYPDPQIYEVSELLAEQKQDIGITM